MNIARSGLVAMGFAVLPVLSFVPQSLAQDAPAAAAATLVGQCRAANKRTPIYSNRNAVSEVVVLLENGNAVILSENGGENGMIGVSKPKAGFVHSPNLKECADKPKPPTAPTGICRKVVQTQGLIVKKEPGNTAPVVGGVALNDKITLAEPLESRELDDGRIWVKVAKPLSGWVSNGFKNQQFRNLGSCE
jgi:Bacterial SH3 domain